MRYIWIFFLLGRLAFGYTNIAPLYLDENIGGEGAYREYIVTNNTEKTLRYRIYCEEKKNYPDMTPWMEIYPSVLTLKAGSRGRIKLYVKAPKKTPEGEYISNLCLKEIEYPGENLGKKLQVYTNLKIELAGYVGNDLGKISLRRKKPEKMILENLGHKRERLTIYFIDEKSQEHYVDTIRLFKEEKKVIENKIFKNALGKIKIVDRKKNILLEKSLN